VREHDPNVDASFDSVSQEPSPATAWDEVANHDPYRVLSLSDRELVCRRMRRRSRNPPMQAPARAPSRYSAKAVEPLPGEAARHAPQSRGSKMQRTAIEDSLQRGP